MTEVKCLSLFFDYYQNQNNGLRARGKPGGILSDNGTDLKDVMRPIMRHSAQKLYELLPDEWLKEKAAIK